MSSQSATPDLVLVLDQDGDGNGTELLAWHQVMINASPVFAKMLQPNTFREGTELQEHGRLRLPLPDTNTKAMRILCDIFHLRTSDVPIAEITSDTLSEVATLMDKFDCASSIRPWQMIWLQQPHIGKEICNKDTMDFRTIVKWIRISYYMDFAEQFKSFTSVFLKQVSEQVLEDADVLKEFEVLPEVLQVKLMEKRETCVNMVRQFLSDLFDELEKGDTCRFKPDNMRHYRLDNACHEVIEDHYELSRHYYQPDSRHVDEDERFCCASTLAGNARLGFRLNFGFQWKNDDNWTDSMAQLRQRMNKMATRLNGLSCLQLKADYDYDYCNGSPGHQQCSRSSEILGRVEQLYQNATMGLELKQLRRDILADG